MPKLDPWVFFPRLNHDGSPVRDRNGKPAYLVGPNPLKESVTPFHVGPYKVASITLAAGGDGEIEFVIDSQGSFEWTHIVGQSTGAYTVSFFDPAGQGRLSNFPVHSGTIVGTARRPFQLPDPYLFNVEGSERRLVAKLHDLSGGENVVRLYLYGRRYYVRNAAPDVGEEIGRKIGRGWRSNNYFLVPKEVNQFGTPLAVAGNGTKRFTFIMDHDEDTDIEKMMASSTGAFSFNLREIDTNRTLSNKVIHSDNGWGTAQFPFRFADTWLLERNKELVCDVTDLSGENNTIYLTLAGRRLALD